MESTGSRRDYRTLLLTLSVLGTMYPLIDTQFWDTGVVGPIIWHVAFWSVLFAALRSLGVGPKSRRVALVLLMLAIGLGVGVLAFDLESRPRPGLFRALQAGSQIVSLAFLLQVTEAILRDVLQGERVNINKIWGAVCVYILIGLIWAHVFGVLSAIFGNCLLERGGFRMATAVVDPSAIDPLARRLYFSFVTLTTVGYGDIAPVHTVAKLMASVEALVGQLYLAILVARLVGLHITHSERGADVTVDARNDEARTG